MSDSKRDFAPTGYLKRLRSRMVPELSFHAANEEEFNQWRSKMRERLMQLLGQFPRNKCELAPKTLETVETEGFVREKVVINSDDGCPVLLYVFTPKKGEPPFKPLIAIHGHGIGMRATAGEGLDEEELKNIREANHDYARQFAGKGYMVFAPEMTGFGERREKEDKKVSTENNSCRTLAFHALMIGKTAIGLRVWDTMRVIDYAETRKECDADIGVGCVGLSGGGTVTLYTTALEARIKCSVVSGYFNTFESSILAMHHCDCNYIPGILKYMEMPDIAAMIAPRPLLIESGTQDEIFPIDAAKASYEKLKKAYEIFDARERLDMEVGSGGHRFYGGKAFDWMGKWLALRR